jgi:hypothetical protein
MFAKLIHIARQSVKLQNPSNKALTCKPAIEALESRSLMDANAYVRGLYANILQRSSPSDAEVNGWVSQIQSGTSLQAVSAAFIGSTEHLTVIVNDEYLNLFGRPADSQGTTYWVQQMENGATQDQVAASLISSEEFLMKHGSTNTQFVTGVYETVLHRAPDDGGLAYWTQRLNMATSRQTTHYDVATAFLSSNEAHQRDVDIIFAETLHRTPTDSERTEFASFMDQGRTESDVTGAIVNTPEYLSDYGVAETPR